MFSKSPGNCRYARPGLGRNIWIRCACWWVFKEVNYWPLLP